MNKLIMVICFLLLPMHSQAADVYKWKDAEGKVRYSDTPPSGKTPYELLSGKNAAAARSQADAVAPPTATDKSAKSGVDKELEAKKRKAEADNLQKKEQVKLEQQKVREENCKAAKANLQNFKQGGRMFTMDENGERRYMDDKDLSEGLDKASKDVEQLCSGQ